MTAVGKGLDKDLENSLTKLTNTIPAANLSEGNKVGKGPPPLRDKEQGMQRRGLHIEAQDIIKAAHTISRERWKALFSVLEVYHVHHGNFRVSYKDIVGGLELEVWIVNLQGDRSANPEQVHRLEFLGFEFANENSVLFKPDICSISTTKCTINDKELPTSMGEERAPSHEIIPWDTY